MEEVKEPDPYMDLMVAAQRGNLEELRGLIASGVDVNRKCSFFLSAETAIISASRCGQVEALQYLISKGGDVNLLTDTGSTCLHVAVHNQHPNCITYLLSCTDIEKNVQNDSGMTALMMAAKNGFFVEAEILARYGCNVELTNKFGQAAIHLSQTPYRGHSGNWNAFMCLKALGSYYEDIDFRDASGETALHYAIRWGNFQSVKWLISQNCDIDADTGSTTPLGIAVNCYSVRIIRTLLDCGCKTSGFDHSYAAKHPETHKLLCDVGKSPVTLKIASRRAIRKPLGKEIHKKVNSLMLPTPLMSYVLCEKELS